MQSPPISTPRPRTSTNVSFITSYTTFTFDVGFRSTCCEYVFLPLDNKETAFSQWLNRIELGGKTKLDAHW